MNIEAHKFGGMPRHPSPHSNWPKITTSCAMPRFFSTWRVQSANLAASSDCPADDTATDLKQARIDGATLWRNDRSRGVSLETKAYMQPRPRLPTGGKDLPVKIGGTPTSKVEIVIGDLVHSCLLKCEGENPFGSIKDRVAWALLDSSFRSDVLIKGGHVVDGSSGNYGVALAGLGRILGLRVTIVAPRKIISHNAQSIARYGADLIVVDEDYTAAARRIASEAHAVYLDQYNNLGNPEIHRTWTAPETLDGLANLDCLFLAASTGGTAAGFNGYLRDIDSPAKVVVVDSTTSFALRTPNVSEPVPCIPGFGSLRTSPFTSAGNALEIIRVSDAAAITMFNRTANAKFPSIGLSSCGVLCGAITWLERQDTPKSVLMICPDKREKYIPEFGSVRFSENSLPGFMVTALERLRWM